MQLDIELVDLADDFGALRFIFCEAGLQFAESIVRRSAGWSGRRE
jgi:hypothetical protein